MASELLVGGLFLSEVVCEARIILTKGEEMRAGHEGGGESAGHGPTTGRHQPEEQSPVRAAMRRPPSRSETPCPLYL